MTTHWLCPSDDELSYSSPEAIIGNYVDGRSDCKIGDIFEMRSGNHDHADIERYRLLSFPYWKDDNRDGVPLKKKIDAKIEYLNEA